ncbi:hypothetical protein ABHN11_24625 [Brevibacillus centrosporus]|uniref:hypothetical protein n=1 Tax=Brevibacillus centrosporus TaxID=54910 RepID=UPI003D256CB7
MFEEQNVLTSLEQQEEMKEHLMEVFENSILYQIYVRRGMVDKLFTEKILSMDRHAGAIYSTQDVADICETPVHNIKNKRKEFMDYLNGEVLGQDTGKAIKYDYIGVFKMKMIDGLTGAGGDYTLKQLNQVLHAGALPESKNESVTGDKMLQLLKMVEAHDNILKSFDVEALQREVSRMIKSEISLALPAPDISETQLKKKLTDIHNLIVSEATDIIEKKKLLQKYKVLESEYPEHTFLIQMQQELSASKIESLMLNYRMRLREKVLEFFSICQDETTSEATRNDAQRQLEQIMIEEPELKYEIKFHLAQIKKPRVSAPEKKGFFSRLFGGN